MIDNKIINDGEKKIPKYNVWKIFLLYCLFVFFIHFILFDDASGSK